MTSDLLSWLALAAPAVRLDLDREEVGSGVQGEAHPGFGVQLMYSLYGGLKDLFWAAVLMCALMGLISYYAVVILEKLILPWNQRKGA